MSKADEMFDDLGYVKVHDEDHIYYNNLNSGCTIEFNKVKKVIRSYDYETEVFGFGIELEELQAINEKVKELGWEV